MVSASYKVKTLFDLSCEKFTLSLEDASSIESLPLPRFVKKRVRDLVKDLWLNQEPLNPIFDYSSVDLLNMTKSDLNMVMNYPMEELGVPDFLFPDEYCHIVWLYYIWKNGERCFRLCRYCYQHISRLSLNHEMSKREWGMCPTVWIFWKEIYHERQDADTLMECVVLKPTNYCDVCVVKPLYDIIDREECYNRYNFHVKEYGDSECWADIPALPFGDYQ